MPDSTRIRHLGKDDFEREIARDDIPVLVDFWAAWCAPCRRIAPILDRIAEQFEGRLVVAKVDVDAEPELARQYEIRSIPALRIFRAGEIVEQTSGLQTFQAIADAVETTIARA